MYKVRVRFENEPLKGPNGPFATVIDERVFYLVGDELAKLQNFVDEREDMTVEVLSYAPTTAKAVIAECAAAVAAQKKKGHY